MNNHNTSSSNAQPVTNDKKSNPLANSEYDLKQCNDVTTRFIDRFNIIKILGECGAYKEKGIPVRVILLYIFNLMFSPMSMYYQIKMDAFHDDPAPMPDP